jgi:WD40 repeat protein
MAIDFNSKYPYLLAAGFYDGSVKVYDIRIGCKKDAKYECNEFHARHKDPVWQVRFICASFKLKDLFIGFYQRSNGSKMTSMSI